MSDNRGVGVRGEQLAAQHLQAAGLTVLARNVRLPAGEIDIVAQDGDELVMVEVKTRIGDASTVPDDAVSAAKLARLDRLAEQYMDSIGRPEQPWRVDVVAIVLGRDGRIVQLEHLRGAYL